jgi:hypothetical protein
MIDDIAVEEKYVDKVVDRFFRMSGGKPFGGKLP